MNSNDFSVYVTVTGLGYYEAAASISVGDSLLLIAEPECEFDPNAVAAFGEMGKIGYVANSRETARENTVFAYQLTEFINGSAKATVVDKTYRDLVCIVEDTFHIDNVCFKAFEFFDNCEYEQALELFLWLSMEYDTLFVNQHIADCYIKLERYADAMPYIEKSLSIDKDNKVSLMMKGFAFEKLEQYDEALELYLKVQKLDDCTKVQDAIDRCKSRG